MVSLADPTIARTSGELVNGLAPGRSIPLDQRKTYFTDAVQKLLEFEIRHLRYLVASAEHGSFRKAAAALHVRESAISRRIRDLEDEVGASLFLRRPDGVSPTLAGQRFLHRVRQALTHIREGTDEVAMIGRAESGLVKVGLFSSLASGFLADLFRCYDENHSNVRADFFEGDTLDHANAIRRFELDVAFVLGSSVWPECETTYLWSEHIFVALSESHHLAAEPELTWDELAKHSFIVQDIGPGKQIREYIIRKIRESGVGPDVDVQHIGRYNVFNLVALGNRVTLVLESETSISIPGVTYRPIQGETAPFSAIWSARNDNPPFRALLSLAKVMARPRGPTEAEF